MTSLISRVARTIRRAGVDGPATRVAAAVSGGADSVALVWLLKTLANSGRLTLSGIVHVNHQLRGAESDADEVFCRDLAARLHVPFISTPVDITALARANRTSIEATARKARYEFFEYAADELGAHVVATGHTQDDQAETVLLRLLRGSGNRGSSAIRLRRGRIIRPLLSCGRASLREYLQLLKETWREDASNEDVSLPRNSLRRDVMPRLADVFPGGVRALARFARLAADDEDFLTKVAIKSRRKIVLSSENPTREVVDAVEFRALPGPIARRVIRETAAKVASNAALSARHLEAVCRLVTTDKPSGHLDLPGLTADKVGSAVTLKPADLVRRREWTAWPERQLPVPGSVEVPEAGITVGARPVTDSARPVSNSAEAVAIRAASATLPLVVRNRRPGDRLQPLGAPGRRKLQDVLVDRKIPRVERDDVPIVTDASGQILWVAGVAIAEMCRVTTPEDGMLILELRKHR